MYTFAFSHFKTLSLNAYQQEHCYYLNQLKAIILESIIIPSGLFWVVYMISNLDVINIFSWVIYEWSLCFCSLKYDNLFPRFNCHVLYTKMIRHRCLKNSISSIIRFEILFPGGSDGKASAYSVGDLGLIPGFDPWVRKIPWRRKWQPAPVLLPGKSHGRRSVVGYSPWGRKESDTTEQLHFTSGII